MACCVGTHLRHCTSFSITLKLLIPPRQRQEKLGCNKVLNLLSGAEHDFPLTTVYNLQLKRMTKKKMWYSIS